MNAARFCLNVGVRSALFLASVQSVRAATYFWDGGTVDIAAAGNGASNPGANGNWNTTTLNWDAGVSSHIAWPNLATDTAEFAGTARTVTVGTVSAGAVVVGSANYIFNGGTLSAGIIDVKTLTGIQLNSNLAGGLTLKATGSTTTIASAAPIVISGNNTGLTSVELALQSQNNHVVIHNAGALGPAATPVKLTTGVLNLGNVGGSSAFSYNAWATELAGGTIRARFDASIWNGATSLTADSQVMTRNVAGVGVTFANTATINLNDKTLKLMPGSVAAGITLNGVISGSGNLTITHNPLGGTDNALGVVTLGAANTFSGTATTTQNLGTFALNHFNALQNATLDTGVAGTQAVTFLAGLGTYNIGNLSGSDALDIGGNTLAVGTKGTSSFSGGITGAGGGSLVKKGTGTFNLSGPSSYTGTTSVESGTLLLYGTHTGGGLIIVSSLASLGGSGSAGDVSVLGGGFFAPGGSLAGPGGGTFNLTGGLTLAPTSTLVFDLDDLLATNDDFVGVGGDLVLGGNLAVTGLAGYSAGTRVNGDKWLLMTYSGALSGPGISSANIAAPGLNPGLSYEVQASSGNVYLAVVPEAGTAGLFVVGLLWVLRRRRCGSRRLV